MIQPALHREDSTVLDWVHIDRTIVVMASGAAAAFFVILIAGWLLTNDDFLLAQSVAPLSVGIVGAVMLAVGRPMPLVQLAVGALGLIIFVAVNESEVPGNPLIGLLIMSIVATVLAHRWLAAVTAVGAAALAAAGWAWHPAGTPTNDRIVMGFSLVVALIFTAWLLNYLKSQSKRSRQRLEQLVASKDEFLSAVSHELRTPLTSILGLSAELDARWRDFEPDELAELTSMLVAESSDMAGIVDDLLVAGTADLGEITLSRQVVDLREAIWRLTTRLASPVAIVDPERDVFVLADPVRIRQIVRNLLTNAERYGGPVVRIVVESDGITGSIAVCDNGSPIAAQDRAQMFDTYYRAGRVEGMPGSAGLGLTVARRLARQMGGELTYSHDGTESVFRLTLPEVSPREVPAEPRLPSR